MIMSKCNISHRVMRKSNLFVAEFDYFEGHMENK